MVLVKRDTVRNALLTSLAAIAFAAPGYAQAPPQQREAGASDRQQVAQFMEDLRMSVSVGASAMLRQVRLEAPRAEFELANPVEVELFKLPEGDLLFRVRVPTMAPTLKWAWELMQPQRTRRPAGAVTPTNLTPASTTPNSTPDPTVQALPAQPSPYVDIDPDEVYTNEVKAAMKNTLIVRSKGIRVPPDRFLTVAARDDGRPDPRFSSSFREFNTVYFSIKGRDLANFHEGRQTLAETEKLVILREE
jgi:hypothetical protein